MRRLRALPRFQRSDLFGLCWIALFVLLYLSPALKDGPSFAPADIGRGLSILTTVAGAPPAHNNINGDIIDQSIPWNTLSYQAVHDGDFPMWNSLSANGLPQFLNFESAVLALPSLVGYLVPLSVSFLVTVAMKLLIAGFGTYLFCRLLGLRALGASFGATTFMLSGAFSGWLGWSISGVFCWTGFVLAGVLLCYRTRTTLWPIFALSVIGVFMFYGGFPEGVVMLAGAVVLFALGGAVMALIDRRAISLVGLRRVGAGLFGAVVLSSPLLIDGVSMLAKSARNGKDVANGLSLHSVLGLFAEGYEGLPIRGSTFFGSSNYFETAAYVGVLALVFVGVALLVEFRRPAVFGLIVAGIGALAVIFRLGNSDPIQALVRSVGLGAVAVQRAMSLLCFFLAVLGAIGLQVVIDRRHDKVVQRAYLFSFGVVALVIIGMWLRVGAAGVSAQCLAVHFSATSCESLRRSSLIWPSASLIGVLVVSLIVISFRRSGLLNWVAASLLVAQSSFLLFAGVGINSYAAVAYPVTPAVATLQSIAKGSIVALDSGNTPCPPVPVIGCGVRDWKGIGFYPEINLVYGIDQLGAHDPVIPQAYFDGWPVPNAAQHSVYNLNLFDPEVDTVALAKRYGARYVLVNPHLTPPAGMQLVAKLPSVAGELSLMKVPGAARFTFAEPGSSIGAVKAGAGSYAVSVNVAHPAVLTARITDVGGWHVVFGGRSLAIERAPGDLIAVHVPAGRGVLQFSYRPAGVLAGTAFALIWLLALLAIALARKTRLFGRLGRARPGEESPEKAGELTNPSSPVGSLG